MFDLRDDLPLFDKVLTCNCVPYSPRVMFPWAIVLPSAVIVMPVCSSIWSATCCFAVSLTAMVKVLASSSRLMVRKVDNAACSKTRFDLSAQLKGQPCNMGKSKACLFAHLQEDGGAETITFLLGEEPAIGR